MNYSIIFEIIRVFFGIYHGIPESWSNYRRQACCIWDYYTADTSSAKWLQWSRGELERKTMSNNPAAPLSAFASNAEEDYLGESIYPQNHEVTICLSL